MTAYWGPRSFKSAPLGRIASVQLGKMLQPERASATDRLTPYLRAGLIDPGANDELPSMWASPSDRHIYGINRGDLLVAEGADVGRAEFVSERCPAGAIIQNSLHRVRADRDALRFVKYCLDAIYSSAWLEVLCNRATFGHLTSTKLKALLLPWPDPLTRERVADFLDAETERIDLTIASREHFLRLLAERRRLAVIHSVAPSVQFGDGNARGWPRGWQRLRLKALVESVQGGDWGEDATGVDDVYCVRAADFDRADLRVSLHKAPKRHLDSRSLNKHLLIPGDLVLDKSGGGERTPVGQAALFDANVPAVATNFAARVRPSRMVYGDYLCLVLAGAYYLGLTARSIKQTTGIQNLDVESFLDEQWGVPPKPEQERIVRRLREVDGATTRVMTIVKQQVALLRERRQVLITAGVTGQIDVTRGAA